VQNGRKVIEEGATEVWELLWVCTSWISKQKNRNTKARKKKKMLKKDQ